MHLEAHSHPHVAAPADGRPVVGIVGGGPVGQALGAALVAAGWQVGAIASRDPARRERFRQRVPGARAFADAAGVLDECHLAIIAVPDDAIAEVAAGLHLYSGQALIHTSGLLGTEVLAAARAAGTSAGSFHPLVAFADVDRALLALRGATVAIEGDEDILDILADMAESIGALPVRLAPGSKPAYHAAAVLAAGGLVALLDVVAEVAAQAGLDEAGALAVYGPLAAQALGNARALGIAPALTGPAVRGDVGTVEIAPAGARRRGTRDARRVSGAPSAAGRHRRIAARPRAGNGGPPACRTCRSPLRRYDLPMQRSFAARFAVRPAARFPTPPPRLRERRLGLHRHVSFQASTDRPTIVRRTDLGPVVLLRADWRAVTPVRSPGATGVAGSLAAVRWAKLEVRGPGRRVRAASAPWRG